MSRRYHVTFLLAGGGLRTVTTSANTKRSASIWAQLHLTKSQRKSAEVVAIRYAGKSKAA